MTDPAVGTVVLVVELTARPEGAQELRERLLELTRLTREEDGCLRYDLHVDPDDPCRLAFVEEWASPEAHAAHDLTPWVDDFRSNRSRLLVEDGVRRLDLRRLEP